MAREKILVIDQDLDSLSKMYLALTHRKFKVEACNNAEEISARLKRYKPAVIVLGLGEYNTISKKLKIPAIVLMDKAGKNIVNLNIGDIQMEKPIHADKLVQAVEKLV